jgi:hypothetical protein
MAAGKYLKEVPALQAISALRAALLAWNAAADKGRLGERAWVLRQLMAAALQLEDQTPVLQVLRDGLSGTGGLSPVQARWSAADLGLPEGRALLLEGLYQGLDGLPPSGLYLHTVERLGETWWPDHLQMLEATARALLDEGIDVAPRLAYAVLHGLTTQEMHFLRDQGTQVSSLHTLIKCHPATFVPEACRLMPHAEWPFILDLTQALWIAGDMRAEEPLLDALSKGDAESGRNLITQAAVMRALGRCAGPAGADLRCSHLETAPEVERFLPEDGICLLVARAVLTVERLKAAVQRLPGHPGIGFA